MIKKIYDVVGASDVIREDNSKSFTVLQCVGEPFFSNLKGCEVCKCFVALGEYKIGDKLELIKVKNDYIVLNKI